MHILHIHDRLSAAGGADLHLLGVASCQAGEHRVGLATGRSDDTAPALPGVELHRVKGLGGRARDTAGAIRRLAALVDRVQPDLLHLHNVVQPAVMEWVAARGAALVTVQDHRGFCPARGRVLPDGRPCTITPSSTACAGCFDDPGYAGMITALTEQRAAALKGFARVVVLSRYMAAELARAGVDAAGIRVIPPFPWSPSPAARPSGAPARPYALAAGRLVWAKGFQLLLDAWQRADPPLPLVIAGDGPARAALEAQAIERGLGPERVRFTGWLGRPAIEGLLDGAQLAVMPSLWAEPFGIAGLEAQARGVPVVAFDVGGVRDWLSDEHGWLVPPNDPHALADALTEAADPAEAQRRAVRAAAFTASHFSPTPLNQRLEATYREVLGATQR